MWSSLKNYTDAVLLIVRAILGMLLLSFHAWPRLLEAFAIWIHHGSHHGFWSALWLTAKAVADTLASILMILGLWTRPAALLWGFFVVMAAVGEAHASLAHAEKTIELGLLLVVLIFAGPGKYSLDKA